MKEKIDEITQEALKEIESAKGDRASLEAARVKYLGRKGMITELFKSMAQVDPAERPEAGRLINILKDNVTKALDDQLLSLAKVEEAGGRLDITLPGISRRLGKKHPITKTIDEILGIFISLGFRVVEGPEIETEYYNFEALNIPLEHPSRDAFDTFYIETVDRRPETVDQKYLLRSHTSPVQIRFMEKNKPPFSIVVPGKVYRPDATDASHSFMFHQVEGLAVGDNIRFSDLKGILSIFARRIFGSKTRLRFRPSFFPFTEPSAEVDISCIICKGQGKCSVCGGKGWLEILGAGMVNPRVFENVGYDSEKITGLAFGMGVERIAMLKYGIDDIRLFFENDIRFLRQF
ncbi:MAG: phenylalanine--tRNA ligase subunit alpha [Omnitrophica bacterium RIFCSPLOWO2_01_FULL_45_10]|nr:MAG: phenylalanine--tRNA ligase subunit alpha [Omnitrophica bacterium RIFCSPLOWO2_01_FULL_45_10]